MYFWLMLQIFPFDLRFCGLGSHMNYLAKILFGKNTIQTDKQPVGWPGREAQRNAYKLYNFMHVSYTDIP